jgi:uncharacterized protein (DUF58 family)
MRTNPLPDDADELVALAQSIATVLSEKRDELGISTDFESLLRVSIAAARYAIDRYVAVLAGAPKSPVAFSCLAEARTRCDRTIVRLRRRVTKCIAQLCRHLDDQELLGVVQYVLAVSE